MDGICQGNIDTGLIVEGGTKIQDPWRKFLFPVDPVLVFSDAAGLKEASSTITKEEIQFIFKIRSRGLKVNEFKVTI